MTREEEVQVEFKAAVIDAWLKHGKSRTLEQCAEMAWWAARKYLRGEAHIDYPVEGCDCVMCWGAGPETPRDRAWFETGRDAAKREGAGPPMHKCDGCYESFSGWWCDNCDTWPCECTEDED